MTYPFGSIPRRFAILASAALVAAGLTVLPLGQDRAEANHGCVRDQAHLVCPLHLRGTFDYTIDADPESVLRLVNNTGESVQIDLVWADPVVQNLGGEFCVFLDHFGTEQIAPGVGSVGCSNKRPTDPAYRPLRWDDPSSTATEGLAVPPGSVVYIQGYVAGADEQKDHRNIIRVTTHIQTRGVLSYRQPKDDLVINCNGTQQATVWGPWKNTTGHDLIIGGAWIYSEPDAANIYILDPNGNIRWTYFGANTRGLIDFPNNPVVHPNESISGQASNTCPVGNRWDWVAWILTWNS